MRSISFVVIGRVRLCSRSRFTYSESVYIIAINELIRKVCIVHSMSSLMETIAYDVSGKLAAGLLVLF